MIAEMMECDGELRFHYKEGSSEFNTAAEKIVSRFGEQNISAWKTVTNIQTNSIHADEVISIIFKTAPAYLAKRGTFVSGRKFFLGKGWVYDKVYGFVKPNTCTIQLPHGSTPLGTGMLVNVYGQPGDADLTRYSCIYFMNPDHASVEIWAGKPLPKGKYSTFYGATVNTEDANKVERIKTFCYDEQGIYSDWDVSWLNFLKVEGLIEQVL